MNDKINFHDLHELALKLAKEPPFTADNIYVDLLLTDTIDEIQSRFDFVLKGGTALIKTQSSPYRFSYDLDFSNFSKENPRKQYKRYQKPLEELITALGFDVENSDTDKHREGGRIFIVNLMDKAGYLKRSVKLSISSIDKTPCFPPVTTAFKPVVKIDEGRFGLLYPQLIPRLNNINARMLTIDELCAEKIRALATRGPAEGWTFLLRDVFDLYVLDEKGVLDKVLSQEEYQDCVRHKFESIKGTGYWNKFKDFMTRELSVKIREEDLSIFFKPELINEKKATYTINKVQKALKELLHDIKE
ncbi:MAG: nucleotidyl transferase AbiEii/AbiGii toxin family protein [Candidatus Micrarchaeota archaeon]